jgi:predicted acylesterase/phospholipase RssA
LRSAFEALDGDPNLFRSWEAAKYPSYNCKIWEACLATSAAPRFFASIRIGDPGMEEEFFDGAVWCNNPTEVLIKEATVEFDPQAKISCIVSIGTGKPKVSKMDSSSYFQRAIPTELIDALASLATSSERVAERVTTRYQNFDGLLHRLNVEEGLQDVSLDEWAKMGEVKSHTSKYLQRNDVDRKIQQIVDAFTRTIRY